jgi:hypothetical protein
MYLPQLRYIPSALLRFFHRSTARRFERDLLNRAEEAEKSSRKLASLQPNIGILGKQQSGSEDWQPPRDGIFNNRVIETREGE